MAISGTQWGSLGQAEEGPRLGRTGVGGPSAPAEPLSPQHEEAPGCRHSWETHPDSKTPRSQAGSGGCTGAAE